jgi:hypothetical protein
MVKQEVYDVCILVSCLLIRGKTLSKASVSTGENLVGFPASRLCGQCVSYGLAYATLRL